MKKNQAPLTNSRRDFIKNSALVTAGITILSPQAMGSSIFLTSAKNEGRKTFFLNKNWKFCRKDSMDFVLSEYNDQEWKTVTIPHDWAIFGPFARENDIHKTMVIEDGEEAAKERTGRTAGLPHVGVGWYRRALPILPEWEGRKFSLEFDGAMSHAEIYINGKKVGNWPYGYSSFSFDITSFIKIGSNNLLSVRLENFPESSRWYPGAGLYRDVRLVILNPLHIKHWGQYITTPDIEKGSGKVKIVTYVNNPFNKPVLLHSSILDSSDHIIGSIKSQVSNNIVTQEINVPEPRLWSVDSPNIYKVSSELISDGKVSDQNLTVFGFRYFNFDSQKGFSLNGNEMNLKGVCLHHDLGPLGAAYNQSAMRYRLLVLQEMGANAIRTAHNPPDPKFLDLCDELGFLVIDEAFDDWKIPKVKNGYATLFNEWAQKDLSAMIRRDRNHPSVIMWSIGNEIRDLREPEGAETMKFLIDICHKEDPTRPVTAGISSFEEGVDYGIVQQLDVIGWNYENQNYEKAHQIDPNWKMYGSETVSTWSSRGEFKLPAIERENYKYPDIQLSSFDMEHAKWGTVPDVEFAAQDEMTFMAGEFVWTGIDYLGEPTPYNQEWPARSSYFGIIDLCGIPKDRYFLYKSQWSKEKVLHLIPHWNWEDSKHSNIDVHCYTNYQEAELFLNGRSLGKQRKDRKSKFNRYRLIWKQVLFEPGELKVVALKDGIPVEEAFRRTAKKPSKVDLNPNSPNIKGDGKEMAFITISILDETGTLCPKNSSLINLSVEGGDIIAVGNGDATSLEPFNSHQIKAFNGKCMVMVSSEKPGEMLISASSKGLKSANLPIGVKRY